MQYLLLQEKQLSARLPYEQESFGTQPQNPSNPSASQSKNIFMRQWTTSLSPSDSLWVEFIKCFGSLECNHSQRGGKLFWKTKHSFSIVLLAYSLKKKIVFSCFRISCLQEASTHYPNHQKYVPTHFMSVDPHWNSKGSGQPEVCQFNHPLVIYQEILRFQVSVQNSSWVAEDNTLQNLVQITLERMRWQEKKESSYL